MIIKDIRIGKLSVPLHTPFKTALRVVESVEDVIVEIHTDTGHIGYGEAPPTPVITGDTFGGIIAAIKERIKPTLIGRNMDEFETLMIDMNQCMIGNTSAKAAIDMALWDLYGQLRKISVHKLLGAAKNEITTDLTISVNEPNVMAEDAKTAITRGYTCLKVKVGKEPKKDIARLQAIRGVVPESTVIRVDANQGWEAKEAVRILNKLYDSGLNIELVEQPVKGRDIDGLRYVTAHSPIPVLADESVFSPKDAIHIIQTHAADMVNIKLMKCGGIYNALKIISVAEIYGVECMLGCMLEAKISVNAAVHLACAKQIITKIDLDGPALCKEDHVLGGADFKESRIVLGDDFGFGIKGFVDKKVQYF